MNKPEGNKGKAKDLQLTGSPRLEGRLPRLAYVGDVPIEASYHGSALLYRLLQRYPQSCLRIVEAIQHSIPERRLPGVDYAPYRTWWMRLLHTRFNGVISPMVSLCTPHLSGTISNLLGEFQPEAVLTIGHGYSWMTAAALAETRGLPLHLIIHDDRPGPPFGTGPVQRLAEKQFAQCYRQAASRLCVSPFMVDEYERRYGTRGTVLFPSRAADARVFREPPERLRCSEAFTIAYAGTLSLGEYRRSLRKIALALARIGGRLLLFGPFGSTQLPHFQLDLPNVECRGLMPSNELIYRLREEAHILFVPMSFGSADREAMRLSFPSKLTDYTCAGLPLLIVGPPDCSAVRWALSNPGAAEVVQSSDDELLMAAVARLAEDVAYRYQLALGAIEIGERHFSHETAEAILLAELMRTQVESKFGDSGITNSE